MSDIKGQKLSVSEWILLYVVITYAPTTRLIAQITIANARQMAWLTPLASLIVYVPLIAVVLKLSRTFEGKSYVDMMGIVFGKAIAKIIGLIMIIYMTCLLALYIRYALDQLTSTIYTGTNYRIFLFFGLFSIHFILRSGITTIGRMNKMVLYLLIFQFFLLMIFLIKDMNLENVTPIHVGGVPDVFKSTIYTLAITGYISFLLIFNDKVVLHKNMKKEFIRAGAFIFIASTMIIFWTLAIFGVNITEKLNYPFFQAVKGIIVFKGMTGMESLFLAFWLLAEFMNIAFFSYCILHLTRNVFNIKSELPLVSAFLIFMFFFSQYFVSNSFELQMFSKSIAIPLNIAIVVVLPFLVFLTGKMRKKI